MGLTILVIIRAVVQVTTTRRKHLPSGGMNEIMTWPTSKVTSSSTINHESSCRMHIILKLTGDMTALNDLKIRTCCGFLLLMLSTHWSCNGELLVIYKLTTASSSSDGVEGWYWQAIDRSAYNHLMVTFLRMQVHLAGLLQYTFGMVVGNLWTKGIFSLVQGLRTRQQIILQQWV